MHALGFTGRIAGAAARHPWRMIVVWLVVLAAAIFAAGSLGDVLTNEDKLLVSTESQRADELIEAHSALITDTNEELVVVEATGLTIDAPGFVAKVDELATALRGTDHVVSAVSHRDGVPGLVSADGTVALIHVVLDSDGSNLEDLLAPILEKPSDPNPPPTAVGIEIVDAKVTITDSAIAPSPVAVTAILRFSAAPMR